MKYHRVQNIIVRKDNKLCTPPDQDVFNWKRTTDGRFDFETTFRHLIELRPSHVVYLLTIGRKS